MKVMLVIPHVSGGGGEKIFSELSCSLDADLVAVVFEERFTYEFKGRLIALNMPISRGSSLSRAYGFIQRILRFRQVVRREKPDVVLSFMGEANFLNALLGRRPIVTVHVHLSAIGSMRSSLERLAVSFLIRMLYRRAVVVAVSRAVKTDLVERFRVPAKQIVVIPNAVDTAKVDSLASEPTDCPWNPDPALPVIITAGRLSPEKGHTHLLRAFAEVRKDRPCQLVILGTGELENDLKRLAKALHIDHDVFFLGWQANPFKFMAKAAMFVLPSLTEAFPLVLIEAMACRLPVIATDSPGASREIVAEGAGGPCGILTPVADESALAAAIIQLLDDEPARERYVAAGLSRVRDFDSATFVRRYQRLLEMTASAAFFPLKIESSIE
jgi:glycosyltransferase involved in cell wall biosynthesis